MIGLTKLATLLNAAERGGVAAAQWSESHPDLDVTAGGAPLCRKRLEQRRSSPAAEDGEA
jgi:hypothetical protein